MLPTPITSSLNFNQVYEPAEDSFLLLDLLEQELPFISARHASSSTTPIVLEIGTGSGIVTTFFHKQILPSAIYLATDLNLHACTACQKTWTQNKGRRGRLDTIRGSLGTALRPHIVDYLVFNPPYVPDEIVPPMPVSQKNSADISGGSSSEGYDDDHESWLDLALLGGTDGMEVTWKVLNDLDSILAPTGIAYILFCKRNKPEQVAKEMETRGWRTECVGERKAGWEVLSVWKFWRVHEM